MIRKISAVLSLVFFCGTSAAFAQSSPSAEATFHDLQGRNVGKAILTQTASGVLIEMELSNVATGEHGFHIHEAGTCDAADGFKSAGGHYEPSQHQHGYLDASGPHAGDMPNQFVGRDGALRVHVLNPNITLSDGPASLFDADGSAIVVHAGPDDYQSQPAGNAGDRIACAVVEWR